MRMCLRPGRQGAAGARRRQRRHRRRARSSPCSAARARASPRCCASSPGCLKPTHGRALWQGQPINGPYPGVAMVFQSFALFPWLTVEENVELGLEALRTAAAERARRAEEAIDLIGLGGFESAYPKELSRRHAPARRLRPRACGASRAAADGRAVLGARRPHRRDACAPTSSTSGSKAACRSARS